MSLLILLVETRCKLDTNSNVGWLWFVELPFCTHFWGNDRLDKVLFDVREGSLGCHNPNINMSLGAWAFALKWFVAYKNHLSTKKMIVQESGIMKEMVVVVPYVHKSLQILLWIHHHPILHLNPISISN